MMRNVALLCLDTVRKDYFDEYAERLIARADAIFGQCRAACCWSVPSHASMVTGRLPHEHGVHARHPRFDSLDPAETLRADLPDHRFVGVSANVYAGSAYGFDALFDEFVDVSRNHRYVDGLDVSAHVSETADSGLARYFGVLREALTHPRPKRSLLNAAAVQLDQWTERGPISGMPAPFDDGAASVRRAALDRVRGRDKEEPFFLFANFMEAHEPHRDTLRYDPGTYSVPTGWDSADPNTWDAADPTDDVETALVRYRDLYGAAIEYLDRSVATFVDRLLDATDRETTVIVTADHGENLALPADDGHLGHVTSLTEGVLHVPLLVVNPPPGYDLRDEGYASHLALRRLIAGLARDKAPSIMAARVPAEVIDITPGNEPLREIDPDYWTRSLRCVYDGETKYEWDSRGVAHRVDLDAARPCRRWRRREGREALPDWIDDHFAVPVEEAADRRDHSASGETLDDDVRRRLRNLGYRR